MDIQAVSGRKSCPRDSLNNIYEAFFQVSFGNHFTLPGSESLFGISQDPPMCKHASLSQVVFQRRDLWVDWHYSPLTSKEPFCACIVRKVSLTLKMRNRWSLSFMWARLGLSYLQLGISIHRGQLQLFGLGPVYLPPLIQRLFCLLDFLKFVGGKDMLFKIRISVITCNDRLTEKTIFHPYQKCEEPPKKYHMGIGKLLTETKIILLLF